LMISSSSAKSLSSQKLDLAKETITLLEILSDIMINCPACITNLKSKSIGVSNTPTNISDTTAQSQSRRLY
jgi:hypothetical protein